MSGTGGVAALDGRPWRTNLVGVGSIIVVNWDVGRHHLEITTERALRRVTREMPVVELAAHVWACEACARPGEPTRAEFLARNHEPCSCPEIRSYYDDLPIRLGRHHPDCPATAGRPELIDDGDDE